jgi:hypothetical protein
MHPYFLQSLAAERTRDMHQQATAMRRAGRARRGRPASPAADVTPRTRQRLAHGAGRL